MEGGLAFDCAPNQVSPLTSGAQSHPQVPPPSYPPGTEKTVLVLMGASSGTQTVKNPPAMQESWVRSMDQEDPLEKGMATHSSIRAWRIPWTEEPGGLQSVGSQKVKHK